MQKWIFFFKFILSAGIGSIVQLAAGIVTIVYTRTMPIPLREYMADNLKSNYTGKINKLDLKKEFLNNQ